MQRLLLDTDPGVDDALAIFYALRAPELRVEAITTVSGNLPVESCTRNLLLILETMELAPHACPLLAQGAARPLHKAPVQATDVHGADGLGNITALRAPDGARRYPEPSPRALEKSAVDLIIDMVGQYPDELVIVAMAPLTNIAMAMRRHPDRMRKLRRLVLMGGAFETYGNVTLKAEFNIFADPHAAQVVFDFGAPLTVTPLDVTHRVRLLRDRLQAEVGDRSDRLSQFLLDATQMVSDFDSRFTDWYGTYLHDPLAVAAALRPELFTMLETRVQVETEGIWTEGMTVAELRARRPCPHPNARVCVEVQAEAILSDFFATVLHP